MTDRPRPEVNQADLSQSFDIGSRSVCGRWFTETIGAVSMRLPRKLKKRTPPSERPFVMLTYAMRRFTHSVRVTQRQFEMFASLISERFDEVVLAMHEDMAGPKTDKVTTDE